MKMNNPFHKTAGDKVQEVNKIAREQAERDKRQEEKKREYEIKEAVKQARKEELEQVKQEALHQERIENAKYAAHRQAMRERPDKRERIAAAGEKAGRLFDNLQKLDKSRPKNRAIRMSKNKGKTIVYVTGDSPIQQPDHVDNRFASLFDVNTRTSSKATYGRNYNALMGLNATKKRRWL